MKLMKPKDRVYTNPDDLKTVISMQGSISNITSILNNAPYDTTLEVCEIAYDKAKILFAEYVDNPKAISLSKYDNTNIYSLMLEFYDAILRKKNSSSSLLKKIIEDINDTFIEHYVLDCNGEFQELLCNCSVIDEIIRVLNHPSATPNVIEAAEDRNRSIFTNLMTWYGAPMVIENLTKFSVGRSYILRSIIKYFGAHPKVIEAAYDKFKDILDNSTSTYSNNNKPFKDYECINEQNGTNNKEIWMQSFIEDILKIEKLSPSLLKKIIEDTNNTVIITCALNHSSATNEIKEKASKKLNDLNSNLNSGRIRH